MKITIGGRFVNRGNVDESPLGLRLHGLGASLPDGCQNLAAWDVVAQYRRNKHIISGKLLMPNCLRLHFIVIAMLFCLLVGLKPAEGDVEQLVQITCYEKHLTKQQSHALSLYKASLLQRIKERWNPAKDCAMPVVDFAVAEDGRISDIKLERSTGIEICDSAAISAVTKSNPLGKLPSTLKRIRVRVTFSPEIFSQRQPQPNAVFPAR